MRRKMLQVLQNLISNAVTSRRPDVQLRIQIDVPEHFNGCMIGIAVAQASVLRVAGILSRGTAAGSGPTQSLGQVRSSTSLCPAYIP
jgi:hypothetical protein